MRTIFRDTIEQTIVLDESDTFNLTVFPRPTATISATDADAGEPNNNGQFTVSLSEAVDGPATINYSVGGTATPGSDYQTLAGSVTLPAGSTSATLPVTVLDDTDIEDSETVVVTLTGGFYIAPGDGNVSIDIGSPSSATVNITNDDQALSDVRIQADGGTNIETGGSVSFSIASTTPALSEFDDVAFAWSVSPAEGVQANNFNQAAFSAIFNAAGEYSVMLTITADGTAISSNPISVMVEQPVIDARFKVETRNDGRLVVVTADTQDAALQYDWNFGEGADPDSISGRGEFGPIEVRYFSGGSKTIALEISDPSGRQQSNNSSADVTVEADPDEVDDLLQEFTPDNPGQKSVTSALANACTVGGLGGNGSTCDALINAASQAEEGSTEAQAVRAALDQLTNQEGPKAAGDAGINGIGLQIGNIGSRLVALRQGAVSGFDIGGLSFQDGDTLISGRQIQKLGEAFMSGGAAGDEEPAFSRLGVFISGRISRGDRDATNNSDAYEYQINGLTLGADYRVRDDLILGAALGYSDTRTDFSSRYEGKPEDKLDSDGLSATFYGTWYRDESFFVDGSVTFGKGDYDQARHLNFTLPGSTPTSQTFNANFDGDHWGIALNAGYEMRLARPEFALTPSLRLQYIRANIDGFRESAANPEDPSAVLGMEINDQEFTSFTSSLGVQASYTLGQSWGVAVPFVGIEWVHEFEKSNDDVTGRFTGDSTATPFSLPVDDNDSNYFNLGVGVSAQFTNGTAGFVNYQQVLGYENLDHYTINAGLRFEF